jgi:hypothetical protein
MARVQKRKSKKAASLAPGAAGVQRKIAAKIISSGGMQLSATGGSWRGISLAAAWRNGENIGISVSMAAAKMALCQRIES